MTVVNYEGIPARRTPLVHTIVHMLDHSRIHRYFGMLSHRFLLPGTAPVSTIWIPLP